MFKLIFSVDTSFVLLSEEKISKKLNEKVKESFELCVHVLISTLFLIIFLMFTSLDTYGTWNVNSSATKTSTRNTYSASLGSKIFILAKKWSQDPLFVVTSFLLILSMSSEFFTGHAFYLFKLIFSVVSTFVLLSEKNIKKIKRKSQSFPKKQ